MDFNVLLVTARTAVIEVLNEGYYHTNDEYEIFVNDESYVKSNRVVQSIYDLNPDTEYAIYIEKIDDNGVKQKSEEVKIKTSYEYVTLNVKDFGAKGDGISDDTTFIQCAINACPKDSRVLIPEGVYKITSLFLKSDIKIELAKDAVLSAITDRNRFPILPGRIESYDERGEYNLGTWEGNPLDCFSGIITGINVSNVMITGQGTIDGCASHENWWKNPKVRNIAWRPRLIFLNHCENITIQGIKVQNSPSWNIHPYFSDNLRFIDLQILNPKDSPNTDGLDPESCRNVEIIGVHFSLGDDCIAIKSGKIYMGKKHKRPSENLMIRQCCMRDGHGSITIGSEMAGGVKNLIVRECLFLHTDRGLRIKTRRGRGEDAIIDGITFENIHMDNVMTPIVINCFYFCDPDGHSEYVQSKDTYPVDDRTPYIGELTFKNIDCSNCHAAAAYMYGLPEQKIKKITFDHVSISYAENPMEGRPAMMDGAELTTLLGLYANNIRTLVLNNVNIEGNRGDRFLLYNVDHVEK
ncbi:MAG: glycoside hydrolase family 28 protein [Clostridiales bacterium]|nr:glycoside hydrolase family 28 protein [Clostridiales bacterium]